MRSCRQRKELVLRPLCPVSTRPGRPRPLTAIQESGETVPAPETREQGLGLPLTDSQRPSRQASSSPRGLTRSPRVMKTQHSPPQSGRRLAHPSSQVRAGWGDPEWLSTAGTPAGPEGRWSVETPCSPAGLRPTSFAATAGPSSPVSPAIRQGPLSRVRAKLEQPQDALCPQEETHNTVGVWGCTMGMG